MNLLINVMYNHTPDFSAKPLTNFTIEPGVHHVYYYPEVKDYDKHDEYEIYVEDYF